MKLCSIRFDVDTFEIAYVETTEDGKIAVEGGQPLKRSVGGSTLSIDKDLLTALEAPIEAIVASLDRE